MVLVRQVIVTRLHSALRQLATTSLVKRSGVCYSLLSSSTHCSSSKRKLVCSAFFSSNLNSTSMTSKDGATEGELSCIKEGKAEVFQPASVFYNPVQEFNRDVTVAVISQHVFETLEKKGVNVDELEPGKKCEAGVSVFEGLSASGLRSVRFAKEVPGLREVIINDFDKNAVAIIEKNIAHNGIKDIARATFGDAAFEMHKKRCEGEYYDVVDLDPYGSATTFLDGAVKVVQDRGLLCVTCTDAAVLCGNAAETCFAKYGGLSLRTKFCHEMALRIILHAIESSANRYGRYIEPLISLSVDFYFRVFVRVRSGAGKAKRSASKTAFIYHCTGCGDFHLQPIGVQEVTAKGGVKYNAASGPPCDARCQHCGGRFQIGGPMWGDAIHDSEFVGRVIQRAEKLDYLGTKNRILGMLSMVKEELPEKPLYYVTDGLTSVLHCIAPNMIELRSAIMNAGYRVSFSHAARQSLKTDAPGHVIWDIMRSWVAEHPIKEKRRPPGSVADTILKHDITTKVSWEVHEDANPASRQQGLLRWQTNPTPCWGPGTRPKQRQTDGGDAEPMATDTPPEHEGDSTGSPVAKKAKEEDPVT